MRGIIFTEFTTFVEEQMGLDALDIAIEVTDLPSGGAYTSVGSYPYAELEALLGTLVAQNPSLEVDSALRSFGKWLAGRFRETYSAFFAPHDNALDFLASIDGHIHTEVRKLDPDAVPPKVVIEKVNTNQYRLDYASHRPLAWVAVGLTEGSLKAYGGDWQIGEITQADEGKIMTLMLDRMDD